MTLSQWALAGSNGNVICWYSSPVAGAARESKVCFILLLVQAHTEDTDTRRWLQNGKHQSWVIYHSHRFEWRTQEQNTAPFFSVLPKANFYEKEELDLIYQAFTRKSQRKINSWATAEAWENFSTSPCIWSLLSHQFLSFNNVPHLFLIMFLKYRF